MHQRQRVHEDRCRRAPRDHHHKDSEWIWGNSQQPELLRTEDNSKSDQWAEDQLGSYDARDVQRGQVCAVCELGSVCEVGAQYQQQDWDEGLRETSRGSRKQGSVAQYMKRRGICGMIRQQRLSPLASLHSTSWALQWTLSSSLNWPPIQLLPLRTTAQPTTTHARCKVSCSDQALLLLPAAVNLCCQSHLPKHFQHVCHHRERASRAK